MKKDKIKQVANKLELFAHNPVQNTGKAQQPRTSLSPAPFMQRKSSKETSIPPTSTAVGPHDLSASETSNLKPSLREVLMAVIGCKFTLTEMTDQLKSIKEEMAFFRPDLQNVCKRTSELKGRVSEIEEIMMPRKKEMELLKGTVKRPN